MLVSDGKSNNLYEGQFWGTEWTVPVLCYGFSKAGRKSRRLKQFYGQLTNRAEPHRVASCFTMRQESVFL